MKKTINAVIVFDDSGSMSAFKQTGQKTYDETLKALLDQKDKDTNVDVSVVLFGSLIKVLESNDNLNIVYRPSQSSTKLFDAVHKGIQILKNKPQNSEDAYLLISLTDGEDNSSFLKAQELNEEIKEVEKNENYTLAFNLPRGYKNKFIENFGVSPNNCREWDLTIEGLQETEQKTSGSISSYSTAFKSGNLRSVSKGFYQYAQLNTAQIDSDVLDKNLFKVTGQFDKLKIKPKDDGLQIRDFVESTKRKYVKGNAFYELVKKEVVQPTKAIIVEDENGDLWSGKYARSLVGIPDNGVYSKVSPENYPHLKCFVESTSYNRKVNSGTELLYKR